MIAIPKSALGKRCFFLAVVLGAIGCLAVAVWLFIAIRTGLGQSDFPLPGFSESRFLNTGPDAKYIGAKACAECHKSQHKSYLLTPHSSAMADLAAQAEPPDGSFFHRATGRFYRVYRRGDQFRHEEVLRTDKGEEIARVDLPIRYVIGSGEATRSYLVEVDGFLHESPITWYTARKSWDMSPGYDKAGHHGFERPVDIGCLSCHAGRVEPDGNRFNRVTIREMTIGCESCHGPGSVHKDFHLGEKRVAGGDDLTIVNPGKLSRPQLESICALCHLNGAAKIPLRGRKNGDFRPGRLLSDYQIDYQYQTAHKPMTVVGHIEQLRLSRCYQKSKNMTCLTCHNPHARSRPKDRVGFYKAICLSCHKSQECGIEHSQRLKHDAQDNCVACHMPRGDTDIPHIAFTHHRIGLHKKEETPSGGLPDLVAMTDDSHLSKIDRLRNLGLAYTEATYEQKEGWKTSIYRERAVNLLEKVREAGLCDGAIEEALARLYFDVDTDRSAAHAKRALQCSDLPAEFRHNAVYILAEFNYRKGSWDAAIQNLKENTQLRRHFQDWMLLGVCRLKQNQTDRALEALRYAVSINPYRPGIHEMLANVYQKVGDRNRGQEHRKKATYLRQIAGRK